jgi:type II secretory pathway pseudopilin PulG
MNREAAEGTLSQEAQSRKRWGPKRRPAWCGRTAYAVTLPGEGTERGAARAPSPASVRRRGISLLELLAAMTAATVVMGTAMSLVHTSYRFESRSRIARADEQTALRLARQFRTDVHEAGSATLQRDGAADAPLVVFTGPNGRTAYRPLARGLVRTVEPTSGTPGREEFLLSRPVAWTVNAEGFLVSLSGSSTDDGRRPQLAIDVAAAVPPGATILRDAGGQP